MSTLLLITFFICSLISGISFYLMYFEFSGKKTDLSFYVSNKNLSKRGRVFRNLFLIFGFFSLFAFAIYKDIH